MKTTVKIFAKSALCATLLAAASFGAQAGGTIGVGPLPIPSTWTVGGFLSGAGTILDVWTFETALPSNASASAQNTYVEISGLGVLNKISSFSVMLNGSSLTALPDMVTDLGGGNSLTTQMLSIAPFTIGPGSHTLKISGTVGAAGGSYSATLALAPAAPIPEPESYAMLLAGLGVMGAIAVRRNKAKKQD